MGKEGKSLVWGILLIVIGVLFLGRNLNWFYFDWEMAWPLLLITGGVLFWIRWLFSRSDYGLMMPGTILLSYGLLFEYCIYYGWYNMDSLWPVFLLGPGLGLLFMYLLGPRENGTLIGGSILSGLAVLFLLGADSFRLFWPLLLIIFGIILLFKSRNSAHPTSGSQDKNDMSEPAV